jgi:hypothetical protein
MSDKTPKSINLLEPVNAPEDVWETVYSWLFNVGKYILISVQVIVLVVFFSRFVIDRTNNDLSDEVNDKVDILNQGFYRQNEIKFRNLQVLLSDLHVIAGEQEINSKLISSVTESVPSSLELQSFSFSDGRVTMSFLADDFEDIQKYETGLRKNPLYSNVKVNLSKSGESTSQIDFSVTFVISENSEG